MLSKGERAAQVARISDAIAKLEEARRVLHREEPNFESVLGNLQDAVQEAGQVRRYIEASQSSLNAREAGKIVAALDEKGGSK